MPRDLQYEHEMALEGLHRATLARHRLLADCRRRMRDANELVREYQRRLQNAQAAMRRTAGDTLESTSV